MHVQVDHRHHGVVWIIALLAIMLLILAPGCREAETQRVEPLSGEATFSTYCASCHGESARGDGPVASELKVTTPDLTQLAAKYDGVFPSEYVLRTIDGRQTFLSHGTRTMPIWGNIWVEDSLDHASEVEAQRRMNALLHFLESIQEG